MCHCIAIGWMYIGDAIPIIQVILHSMKNGLSIDVDINDNCVIAWNLTWKWFIAFIIEKLDNNHSLADHQERSLNNNHFQWKYHKL